MHKGEVLMHTHTHTHTQYVWYMYTHNIYGTYRESERERGREGEKETVTLRAHEGEVHLTATLRSTITVCRKKILKRAQYSGFI